MVNLLVLGSCLAYIGAQAHLQIFIFAFPTSPSSMLAGGSSQRLSQLKAQDQPGPQESKLASQLMTLWSWGTLSAPLVQTLADAAHQDGLTHPDVVRMAMLGGRGKFPGNMQRDLLAMSPDFALLQKAQSSIPIRIKKQKHLSEELHLTFLLPHKLFAVMFETLPTAFQSSILGGDAGNIPRFWAAMHDHPIVTARPDLRARPDLAQVVPIALHGDGVSYMQTMRAGGKSLDVLSWSSLLSHSGSTKTTNFLMFLLVKSLVKDSGMNQTWTMVWRVLTWSLKALSTGFWPLKDWNNEEFEQGSIDYEKRGTALAGGFSAFVFLLRSDLEFLALHFGLENVSSNTPCALCQANRDMQSRPWTDCRMCAAWRTTVWELEGWSREHPDCHPFFQMHGAGIDLFFPDLMHCKHLGTDQVLLGSVLTWLVKHYLKGSVADNLAMVWEFIEQWYKDC